jgi:hypothetical protein
VIAIIQDLITKLRTEQFETDSIRAKTLAILEADMDLSEKLFAYGQAMREFGHKEGHNLRADSLIRELEGA